MAERLKGIGTHITRYGLVIVLLWIGGMKFTAYEAEGIKPLVANSPLMSSVYRVMSVGGFSSLLGVVEITIGMLIALRPVWPMGSAVGSGLAAGMFLTTLSFLVTTPGWEPSLGGFPALSAMPGQFLLKDVVLLGVACRRPARRWRQCAGVASRGGHHSRYSSQRPGMSWEEGRFEPRESPGHASPNRPGNCHGDLPDFGPRSGTSRG